MLARNCEQTYTIYKYYVNNLCKPSYVTVVSSQLLFNSNCSIYLWRTISTSWVKPVSDLWKIKEVKWSEEVKCFTLPHRSRELVMQCILLQDDAFQIFTYHGYNEKLLCFYLLLVTKVHCNIFNFHTENLLFMLRLSMPTES